jgi:hypothetical protein
VGTKRKGQTQGVIGKERAESGENCHFGTANRGLNANGRFQLTLAEQQSVSDRGLAQAIKCHKQRLNGE